MLTERDPAAKFWRSRENCTDTRVDRPMEVAAETVLISTEELDQIVSKAKPLRRPERRSPPLSRSQRCVKFSSTSMPRPLACKSRSRIRPDRRLAGNETWIMPRRKFASN